MVVYKYELHKFEDQYEALMPPNGKVLSINAQNGELFLWALVDPMEFKTLRQFDIYGTGYPVPSDGKERQFINTFFTRENQVVFHAFEVIPSNTAQ